jgi:hypothetical protein
MQGKVRGVRDSPPLGTGMDSCGYIADARSTARTGASPSPPSTAARRQTSKNARWPPRATPQKAAVSRENPARVRDSRPLGSGMGSSACSQREQVLPQRGHGHRPLVAQLRPRGSTMAIMAPRAAPWKGAISRGKACRGDDAHPLGAMDMPAFRPGACPNRHTIVGAD